MLKWNKTNILNYYWDNTIAEMMICAKKSKSKNILNMV